MRLFRKGLVLFVALISSFFIGPFSALNVNYGNLIFLSKFIPLIFYLSWNLKSNFWTFPKLFKRCWGSVWVLFLDLKGYLLGIFYVFKRCSRIVLTSKKLCDWFSRAADPLFPNIASTSTPSQSKSMRIYRDQKPLLFSSYESKEI